MFRSDRSLADPIDVDRFSHRDEVLMKCALLGTGLMGYPMSVRLLRAGYSLTVWNRTRSKALGLAELGATVADTPAEAVVGADVVFLVLENGAVVNEVLRSDGLRDALKAGSIVVDHSSIPPWSAREQASYLSSKGVSFLDAPVSGGPGGVDAGTLAIMVGGDEQAFLTAKPLLANFGKPVLVGPSGSGQIAKLCSQVISAAALNAVAEAMLLAQAAGADPGKLAEALAGGFADSKILQIHSRRMIERDFMPGGHIRTFVKDLRTALKLADDNKLEMPLAKQATQAFSDLSSAGFDDNDISAIILNKEEVNGISHVETTK
jgi:2-hydroxy-3-oxopropionate reductase